MAQEFRHPIIGQGKAAQVEGFSILAQAADDQALGQMARQLREQSQRQPALELQGLQRLLPRLQQTYLGLQHCQRFDAGVKASDVCFQQLVFFLLHANLALQPNQAQQRQQQAQASGQTQFAPEALALLLAGQSPVRQKIEGDHGLKLRSARPQAVR